MVAGWRWRLVVVAGGRWWWWLERSVAWWWWVAAEVEVWGAVGVDSIWGPWSSHKHLKAKQKR